MTHTSLNELKYIVDKLNINKQLFFNYFKTYIQLENKHVS